jgi:hypothetical protein
MFKRRVRENSNTIRELIVLCNLEATQEKEIEDEIINT